MARREQDREDLLREASALVRRAEWQIEGQPVVVGFRRDGSASVFLDVDPVYQFDSAGRFRRGFLDGDLLKAERGAIVRLRRERDDHQVALHRSEMHATQQQAFLREMRQRLRDLEAALAGGTAHLVGQHPPGADLTREVRQWLAGLPDDIPVAHVPNVR